MVGSAGGRRWRHRGVRSPVDFEPLALSWEEARAAGGLVQCNRGKHLVPVFHKRSGGFALEIGGEVVAVDARSGELCNHLFCIVSV